MSNQQTKFKNTHTAQSKNADSKNADKNHESQTLVRTHIVKSIIKNLLGPKCGHDETIESPYDQYMVGILKPRPIKTKSSESTCIIDNKPLAQRTNTSKSPSELEVVTDPYEKASFEKMTDIGDYDSETIEEDFTIPVDADLNLMQGAHSLGLSFVVNGTNPIIHICCTWGRYELTSLKKYKRHTNVIVTNPLSISQHSTGILNNDACKINTSTNSDAEIYISVRPTHNKQCWSVSVFLSNRAPYFESQSKKLQWNTQSFFQPQIRVTCECCELQDLGHTDNTIDHDRHLFDNKPTKGRGHLCGVVWKDVDPGCIDRGDFLDVLWPDSQSSEICSDVQKQFSCPDIRTEYFPMYVILQPDTQVSTLEFNAQQLSELWDSSTLKNKLTPIASNYEDWITKSIGQLKQEYPTSYNASQSPELLLQHADKQLKECSNCSSRIRDGINLLVNDEKARLSFCFMNKAISLKNQWKSSDGAFSWRAFQIAFILQTLPGLTIPGNDKEKDICDVLWFPTGGGKTEAYLGLMLFSFAYRRLCTDKKFEMDGGVSVISRYTLRLLSLQQFRRTLDVILGSEILRIQNWRPAHAATFTDKSLETRCRNRHLWGESRFSLGLWVGGDLTPNIFPVQTTATKDILNAKGALSPNAKNRRSEPRGEPAQINKCPCCNTTLAIPDSELFLNNPTHTLIWIIRLDRNTTIEDLNAIPDTKFRGHGFELCKKGNNPSKKFKRINENELGVYCALHVNFKAPKSLSSDSVDSWWEHTIKQALPINLEEPLQSTRASRPGYFFLFNENRATPYDFVIHCPNSDCPTWNEEWSDKIIAKSRPAIADAFRKCNEPAVSVNVPIPAFTTDEQVYGKCPTVIIATTDKFAQLAFKPDAASIFGNVDSHHALTGFCRKTLLSNNRDEIVPVSNFYPPSLIIQDELHMIEGPLGSMVGLYELAVDTLSSQGGHKPKYVASTATVKEASRQVDMIYRRSARIFPPNGVHDGENYFSSTLEDPTCVKNKPGRLYVGVLVTRGKLLGLVKTYASILSSVYDKRSTDAVDPYWTLVGYFNAIRELAIAKSLYNSDIERDVKELSSAEYFSTDQKNTSKTFESSTRFIPIKLPKNATLNSITVHCSNNLGKISVALYDSDPKTHKPSKVLSEIDVPSAQIASGPNKFNLKQPPECSTNSIVYVALHNYSNETKFVCGSEIESYASNSLQHKGDSIVFETIHSCMPEKTPIMISVKTQPRDLDPSRSVELSSIVSSYNLPKILEQLETSNSIDALFTTSIFGTGVDINRLGLMLVAGQPKSTASYIQSTGRIGRQHPGLVVTWLQAARVRDLSHYENFVGYHRSLNRFVEPISSAPFSYKSLKTCLGPVLVAILRNASKINTCVVPPDWATNPNYIIKNRNSDEIAALETRINEVYAELTSRIDHLQLNPNTVKEFLKSATDRWLECAQKIAHEKTTLEYSESTLVFEKIQHNVVLGTPHHEAANKTTVYELARRSLRDVESMFTIQEMEEIEND